MIDFKGFPKIARLSRRVVVTEKIDGTNAQICIVKYKADEDVDTDGCIDAWMEDDHMFFMYAGSRNKWIFPSNDNYGFAKWAQANRKELRQLGVGQHFGEWWGKGIQRNYGLEARRFSLFNTIRWCRHNEEPQQILKADPSVIKYQDVLPICCDLVPVLYDGVFDTVAIDQVLQNLKLEGSVAKRNFMNPEGIVVFHEASNTGFKKTIEKDDSPKSLV